MCVCVCICLRAGLSVSESLCSLSHGRGEQMAGRMRDDEREFRNGNGGMRGLIVRHRENKR